MERFNVTDPGKLLDFLYQKLAGYKRTTVKNLLKERRISVNGKFTTKFDYSIYAGDKVVVEHDRTKAVRENLREELNILYEDDDIVVIDKPSGLLTVSTEKEKNHRRSY